MKNIYRKYLMVFEQDKNWGFYMNSLGRTVIEKKYAISFDRPSG